MRSLIDIIRPRQGVEGENTELPAFIDAFNLSLVACIYNSINNLSILNRTHGFGFVQKQSWVELYVLLVYFLRRRLPSFFRVVCLAWLTTTQKNALRIYSCIISRLLGKVVQTEQWTNTARPSSLWVTAHLDSGRCLFLDGAMIQALELF